MVCVFCYDGVPSKRDRNVVERSLVPALSPLALFFLRFGVFCRFRLLLAVFWQGRQASEGEALEALRLVENSVVTGFQVKT